MKKSSLLLSLACLLLCSCGDKEPQGLQPKPGQPEEEQEPTISEQQEEENTGKKDTYTAKVVFSSPLFAEKFSEGTNFTSDSKDKNEELRLFIDDQLEYYDLVTGLELDCCTTRKYDSATYLQINTGKNGANAGYLKWTSDYKIYNVKISALNYANPYTDYKTGTLVPNVENNAVLKVNNLERNLSTNEGEMPSVQTLESYEFSEGITTFTLTATGARVLIKELEITWRG